MSQVIKLFGDKVGKVEYIDHMGSDITTVNAARVSFGRTRTQIDEKDEKLIKYLIKNNHTSPFEHCSLTFRFTVPLFIRSQHHRHRTWAYNEISRRYTSIDMEFYEPSKFRTQHESNRQASKDEDIDPLSCYRFADFSCFNKASKLVKMHNKCSLELYNSLVKEGVCREQARGVLPQNLYTSYYGTCNLHNLIKFINLRSHSGAQWEIQQVAKACQTIAEKHFPITMAAFKETRNMD